MGEILDRALVLLKSSWPAIFTLVAIAFIPTIILHFFESSLWVRAYGAQQQMPPLAMSSWYLIANHVLERRRTHRYDRSDRGSGLCVSLDPHVCTCAVVAASTIGGRMVGVREVVNRLSDRRVVVVAIAVMAVVADHALIKLWSLIPAWAERELFYTGANVMTYILFRVVLPYLFEPLQQGVWLAASCAMTASILEADTLGEALSFGGRAFLSRGRVFSSLLLCVAFAFIRNLYATLLVIPASLLYLTRVPLIDTLADVVISVPPLAFIIATTVLYYFDYRLRQGVNVAVNVTAELEMHAMEPA